ncbi:MAG: hypothetical protein RLP44_22490 [Aggregatilineales bacterium]
MPITQDLHANWTLRALSGDNIPDDIVDRHFPATVPGTVYTDLMAVDAIEDPYYDRNELKTQWIGETDWCYSTTFTVDEALLAQEIIELACDGLDTVATIIVNDQHIADTENMHVRYRFNVKDVLKVGENTLEIRFRSALAYAIEQRDRLGDMFRPLAYQLPFNFIRKNACNFGWDWGPTLITAGIWRGIRLEGWNTVRIADVRPLVMRANENAAHVRIFTDLAYTGDRPVGVATYTIKDPEGNIVGTASAPAGQPVDIWVENPQLWWPNGYGEQPLYTVEITVKHDDVTLDSTTRRIGMRQVRLLMDFDDIGMSYTFEINGQPIFAKGANWIPDDVFVTRVTPSRYRERIQQAVDSNMNMLRIWGGGIYEDNVFYDICDELGIMIWQDFLFSCALYPEAEPFRTEAEAEARDNIIRLSHHPSLVLWNGNNENVMGYWAWESADGVSWREYGEKHPWGGGYYFNLLPSLVAALDPSRPYSPASPWGGSMDIDPADDNYGSRHIWDVWNSVDYTTYLDYIPRFVSEFGFQAPPTLATINQSIPLDQQLPDSDSMLHHQKATDGNGKLARRMAEHFTPTSDFYSWHYLTQMNQARAITLGVTWWRSQQPTCMGTLYWQINDCWPVTSWASVDGYGRKKPLWYATRRFYAPRLLTFQTKEDELALYAINDSFDAWQGEVIVRLQTFTGETLAEETLTIDAAPQASTKIALPESLIHPADQSTVVVSANCGDAEALHFFARDKDIYYPKPDFDAEIVQIGDRYQLTISAKTLLRDLCIFVDHIDPDAQISDQMITILPGESFVFEIESTHPLTVDALTQAPIFQTINAVQLSSNVRV